VILAIPFRKDTGEFGERQEIGADEIVQATGKKPRGGEFDTRRILGTGFQRNDQESWKLQVSVGFTDDLENDIVEVTEYTFG
jgi:hypothetical protein